MPPATPRPSRATRYSREELKETLVAYNAARDRATETDERSIWANVFTDDAEYVEHAYGAFKGEAASPS